MQFKVSEKTSYSTKHRSHLSQISDAISGGNHDWNNLSESDKKADLSSAFC